MNKGYLKNLLLSGTDNSDNIGGKHYGCEYFVLDVTHDPFAKQALASYVRACELTYPNLYDMVERYDIAKEVKTLEQQEAALKLWGDDGASRQSLLTNLLRHHPREDALHLAGEPRLRIEK